MSPEGNQFATAATPEAVAAVNKPPKPKRVVLSLETSTRARNKFGKDFYGQILWMRLDGLSIDEISAELRCDDELITAAIMGWQTQVEVREGPSFEPRARNGRRWKNRPRKPEACRQHPLRLAA